MEASLIAKIKVLESNYSLLQKEHSILLKGLHEEIEKLQRKYSELTFDYTIRLNKSLETMLLEDKIKQLQASIKEKNEEIESERDNFNRALRNNQEKEAKLLQEIEDQKNTIESLEEIISQQSILNKGVTHLSEKNEKPRKEVQTEKVHRRKKKKSVTPNCDSGKSSTLITDRSPNIDQSKLSTTKISKSATASSVVTPLDEMAHFSSENESFPKKGKRDKRSRKKNSAPPLCVGEIPILPSDYRAVVATLPPITQSQGATTLECDTNKFIPCTSKRHSGYSALQAEVSKLSHLHKGLQKPPLKVEGFN